LGKDFSKKIVSDAPSVAFGPQGDFAPSRGPKTTPVRRDFLFFCGTLCLFPTYAISAEHTCNPGICGTPKGCLNARYTAGKTGLTPIRRTATMAAFDTTRTAYGSASAVSRFFVSALESIVAWNDSRVTRKALSALSDRELEDIGLIRGDIDRVAQSDLIR
jgi:uncharacterized protein YjiS (DUF1127 family)